MFGIKEFEGFLKSYIETFAHLSLTTDEWKDFIHAYFSEEKIKLESVDWDTWLNKPGMPPVKNVYDTSLQDVCTKVRQILKFQNPKRNRKVSKFENNQKFLKFLKLKKIQKFQ